MGGAHAGRYNRIAVNDFHEKSITAENYISKDLINISIPSIKKDIRPLVPAQRKQLHQLILTVADAGNEESYEVWRRVHAEIGVKSVEEMTVSQYQPACNYLYSQMNLHQEISRKNEMVSSLLKVSAASNSYPELLQYCRKSFGSSRLKSLQCLELQQALLWLYERRHQSPEEHINKFSKASFFSLLSEHPLSMTFVFLLGFSFSIFILFFMKLEGVDVLSMF